MRNDKKTEALVKLNEVITLLSEAFIEDDRNFNILQEEIYSLVDQNKEQEEKICALERLSEMYQAEINYLQSKVYAQEEKNRAISRILMED